VSRFDDADQPEDLTAWLAAGLRRREALEWRRWRFTLSEAQRWIGAGVGDALTAAQWQLSGANADTVNDWQAASIGAAAAIRWHEFGFGLDEAKQHAAQGRGPAEAYNFVRGATAARSTNSPNSRIRAFLDAGVPPQVMHGYVTGNWSDEAALSWAKQGIEVGDARAWQLLGLSAAEAGELTRAGKQPLRLIEDWWSSGIPIEEVGDWLGAGLTPEEAVTQRASGITVEQAAALRALRHNGP
jgi:hypothetical protein